MKIRWIKVLRELWSNKARTVLVVLSIAVGVFAVGSISNSWIVLLNDLNQAYMATNPASAVLGVEPFDDDLVNAVQGMREVGLAEGRRSIVVKMTTPDGELFNLNLDAVDDFADLSISRMTPEKGVWPPERRQLLLERSWEEYFGFAEGDPVLIEMPDGQEYELVVAGYVHDLHYPPAGNTEVAYGYVTLDTLQWLGEPRYYNKLYLTVAENQLDEDHISEVVSRVKDLAIERNGYTVLTTQIPTPGEQFLTPIIQGALIVLGVVGIFSLLLSGALVVNTVSAVITRQVRQIGVMKAIGGSRSQIGGIYLSSVAIFGLLSLAVAVPLATLGTRALTSAFTGIGNFDIVTVGIPPFVIALEVIVGLLVPMVAGMIPVYFGTRITVREAISDYGIGGDMGRQTVIDRLVGGIRGLPGTLALALRNTFRRKGRLALTLGTLTLAGAIFIAVLSVRVSLFSSFEDALAYTQYDLSVDLGKSYRTNQLAREAARVPGVVTVEGWLQQGVSLQRGDGSESANYTMIGVPPNSPFLDPVLVEGRWLRPGDRNKIVVNSDFVAEEPNVSVGDTIVFAIGDDDYTWEVVGQITGQYTTPVVYVGYEDLGRALNRVGLANRVVIQLSDTAPEFQSQAAQGLEDRFKKAGLLVGSTTTRSEFVDTFEARFNFLIVFLLFMAFLLAFVGGLGLAGTMGLNILERVREIGVMRAIGASDRAIRWIVLAEAVLIGVISWAMAAALSYPLSKMLSDGVGYAFGGEPLTFSYSVFGALLWFVLALLIAVISSYLPARRASRLSVREVLAYE
jgi:putative ABC transport system permease protein